MKKLIRFSITGVVIVIGVVLILSCWSISMQKKIDYLYEEKQNNIALLYGVSVKDKGNVWIRESAEHDELFVLGSSELNAPVGQNIKRNFPNTEYENGISTIGHAYVQNGLHAMNLGANYRNFKNHDIVLIESIQWFSGDDINIDGFMSSFSELQFYEFLNNKKISDANKKYLCDRYLEVEQRRVSYQKPEEIKKLTAGNAILAALGVTDWFAEHYLLRIVTSNYDYPQTHILAKLYLNNYGLGKIVYQLMRPYYAVRFGILSLKDQYETLSYLQSIDVGEQRTLFETDWEKQMAQAEEDGVKACTNNDIYVYDDYYTKYLKDNWAERKDSSTEWTALKSKEWEDFQFMLRVCEDLEISPYIINVSTNAYYYDYIGVDPEMRQEYYAKLSKTASEYEIPVYNGLTDKEYEPYVFADVMHLGWKGWIYVTKAITEHFK